MNTNEAKFLHCECTTLKKEEFSFRPISNNKKPMYLKVDLSLGHLNSYRQENVQRKALLTKGPGAKNDTSKSPGCFNQILTFESRKWSPVATF